MYHIRDSRPRNMDEDIRYRVGCFKVTLIAGDDDEIRPWSHAECECEEYAKISSNPMLSSPQEERCKHIRAAELFHMFRERVSPIEE